MAKYYLCVSCIRQGECEYEEHYFIKVLGELPDDAERQLSIWNWGDEWDEEDQCVWSDVRMCYDCIVGEVSPSTIADLSQFIYVCQPNFKYEEKGNE